MHGSTADDKQKLKADEKLCKILSDGNKYYVDLDFQKINDCLTEGADVETKSKNGEPGLWRACVQNNRDVCNLFLDHGADPSIFFETDGTNALHMAACYLDCPNTFNTICKIMKEKGELEGLEASCGVKSISNYALMFASQGNKPENIKVLLKAGCPVDPIQDDITRTALMVAAGRGRLECASILLKHSADTKLRDQHGQTALHYASNNNYSKLIGILIENNADINSQDDEGSTPLHLAIRGCYDKVIKTLIRKGADIHVLNNKGSALHNTAMYGNVEMLAMFLEKGANIDALNKKKETALMSSVISSKTDMASFLIDKGANIKITDKRNRSLLHIAVYNDDNKMVKVLLEEGADVNFQDLKGYSPLHLAIRHQYDKVIKTLICNGADPDTCTEAGSVLHYAIVHKNVELALLLLDKGADINIPDKNKKSPLHIAVENGDNAMVEFLLENSADINFQDFRGDSPLQIALKGGHLAIASMLLKKHPNLNLQNTLKATALHTAIFLYNKKKSQGMLSVISELINKKEIDLSIFNSQNKTPMDLAFTCKVWDVVDLFERYITERNYATAMMTDKKWGTHSPAKNLSKEVVKRIIKTCRNSITRFAKGSTGDEQPPPPGEPMDRNDVVGAAHGNHHVEAQDNVDGDVSDNGG